MSPVLRLSGNVLVRLVAGILAFLAPGPEAAAAADAPAPTPERRTVLVSVARLEELRSEGPDGPFAERRRELVAAAARLVAEGRTYAVTDNPAGPDGASPHDYYSLGPYWWPDPSTPDGLPWIRRDGQVNPERDRVSDRAAVAALVRDVGTLALAHALDGDPANGAHAARLLRTWFLDPETRMEPHLLHAQAVPGVAPGRGTGIIDTHGFAFLVDDVLLLEAAGAWAGEDAAALRAWFGTFLDWLLAHPQGRQEAAARNNHGTTYDLQVLAIARFLGRDAFVAEYLRSTTLRRIDAQIAPDGGQPFEEERTKSWNYVCENLRHFLYLAVLGEKVGVDLLAHPGDDGGTLRAAAARLLPYVAEPDAWPFAMIVRFDPERSAEALLVLDAREPDGPWAEALDRALAGPPSLDAWLRAGR